jgi:hypothetical protein
MIAYEMCELCLYSLMLLRYTGILKHLQQLLYGKACAIPQELTFSLSQVSLVASSKALWSSNPVLYISAPQRRVQPEKLHSSVQNFELMWYNCNKVSGTHVEVLTA